MGRGQTLLRATIGAFLKLSIARLFAYTRQLEDTLARERAEHIKELSRVSAERERERAGRNREWERANAAEALAHKIEEETRYMNAREMRLPLTPGQTAEMRNHLSALQGGEKTAVRSMRGINAIVRENEAKSATAAAIAREQDAEYEAKMVAEAKRFAQNGTSTET